MEHTLIFYMMHHQVSLQNTKWWRQWWLSCILLNKVHSWLMHLIFPGLEKHCSVSVLDHFKCFPCSLLEIGLNILNVKICLKVVYFLSIKMYNYVVNSNNELWLKYVHGAKVLGVCGTSAVPLKALNEAFGMLLYKLHPQAVFYVAQHLLLTLNPLPSFSKVIWVGLDQILNDCPLHNRSSS